jgi:uncharacterized membrane protein YsdA (DUF1294 family)
MDSILPDIPVWAALAILNLGAFLAFWIDKRQAEQGGTRIEERRLILLAAIGGSVGAKLGQVALRHKTTKQPFGKILTGILVVHCLIALLILRP